jgi:hypothetical protein
LQIQPEQLKNLSDSITMLRIGEYASPYYLARKTGISNQKLIALLTGLAHRSLLGLKFIIKCGNEDPDLIHAFEFSDDDELAKFIRENGSKCIHCGANLVTSDIRVAFVKVDIDINGDVYE